MADKTEKKLADMTADEIQDLIKAEDDAHKKRMVYLRALAKAVASNS